MGSVFSTEEVDSEPSTTSEDFVLISEAPKQSVIVKNNEVKKKPAFDITKDLMTSSLFMKQRFMNSEPLTLQSYVTHALSKKFQNVDQ